MDNDINVWLYDILQSIEEIESYIDGRPRIFEDYVGDNEPPRRKRMEYHIGNSFSARRKHRGILP